MNQRWSRVARKTGHSQGDIQQAVQFLRRNVHPYPLSLLGSLDDSSSGAGVIWEPDLIIHRVVSGDRPEYRLEIPGEQRYALKVAEGYLAGIQDALTCTSSDRLWVRQQSERAQQVVLALQHRWDTLRRLGQYLVEHQRPFLEQGPAGLKPVTRQQVARARACTSPLFAAPCWKRPPSFPIVAWSR